MSPERVCSTHADSSRQLQSIPNKIIRGGSKPEMVSRTVFSCVRSDFSVVAECLRLPSAMSIIVMIRVKMNSCLRKISFTLCW